MKPVRILALVPAIYGVSPGQRFRIEQWEGPLRSRGIEIVYAHFEDKKLREILYKKGHQLEKAFRILLAFFRRLFRLPSFRRFDAVYLYREAALAGPAIIESLLRWMGVPIIYDFDDAIWLPAEGSANKAWNWVRFPQKTATICKLSTHVIVGNDHLAEYARKYNPDVTVIPSVIDTQYHTVREEKEKGPGEPVVIGWTGSYSTLPYLDAAHTAFQRLAQEYSIRLHVIGAAGYSIKDVDVVSEAWKPETEIPALHQFDIGVMPLPDNEWARGKCGFKILQYMACGIPAVASPVGVNSGIIEDGVTGYLVAAEGDWVEKLSILIKDRALRERMGAAGRKRIEERYSVAGWIDKIAGVMKSATKH